VDLQKANDSHCGLVNEIAECRR